MSFILHLMVEHSKPLCHEKQNKSPFLISGFTIPVQWGSFDYQTSKSRWPGGGNLKFMKESSGDCQWSFVCFFHFFLESLGITGNTFRKQFTRDTHSNRECLLSIIFVISRRGIFLSHLVGVTVTDVMSQPQENQNRNHHCMRIMKHSKINGLRRGSLSS